MPDRSNLNSSQLPPPDADAEAQAQSERLIGLVREAIAHEGGRIPFDRYMELALYAPWVGYYTGGMRKFGAEGDFVTAPEISPLFSRCLGRQCQQVLERLGGGDILEFGAGSGAMAADLLAELDRQGRLPGRYLILDLSPELRQRQHETLQSRVPHLLERVRWLDVLPETPFNGVVLANELLDAMPVQRFRVRDGELLEQHVAMEQGRFIPRWEPVATPGLAEAVRRLVGRYGAQWTDYQSEINLRAEAWVQGIGQCLGQGLALLIDYGYGQREYYHAQRDRGTLMCHYRHRAHDDPFVYPGLQDITAHVDFTAVAWAARASGFEVAGFTTQAFFLMGAGLDRLLAEADPDDAQNYLRLIQGVKRLTLPTEMGERFKVLGLGKGLDFTPLGFAVRDQRERL
ncbi:MAG: class I SAM-dependent methyltransferase [gamma proteobacterium symbiont of Phacoides pectinatus]